MCVHGEYAGETASGDLIIMDCPACERRREWDEDDRRDELDRAADLRNEDDPR